MQKKVTSRASSNTHTQRLLVSFFLLPGNLSFFPQVNTYVCLGSLKGYTYKKIQENQIKPCRVLKGQF